MRNLVPRFIRFAFSCCIVLPAAVYAQSDAAKIFKTNCVLCHSENGSGDSATGKALHAKDLRSDEVQKQSDAALAEVITKGKGKMPAFRAKIHPEGVAKLVAYIRALPKK
ncbi:MAG: c-type cytochrome [Terriglobales bacterium]